MRDGSWRRVLVVVGVVACVGLAITYAPLALHAYQTHREREAERPHPIVATDAQQAAIIRALMLGVRNWGPLPPPPPPPNHSSDDAGSHGLPLLVDRTMPLTFCPGTETDVSPPLDCPPPPGYESGNWLYSDHESLRDMPLGLRREMVLANTTSMAQPDPGLPGTRLVRFGPRSEIRQWWSSGAGAVETTRAVVSVDGTEALVYGATLCGPNCDGGALFLFRHDGPRWRLHSIMRTWGHTTFRCEPSPNLCSDRASPRAP
jgi:hypothetical protein